MSKFVPATIRCRCSAEFGVLVAESIHATRIPEIRQQIMDGSFHVFRCESCGHDNHVEKLFAYLDFSAKQWLTVFPEPALDVREAYQELDDTTFRQTMLERSPELVKAWAPEFTRRVVCGRGGLREKLIVLDARLDDRLVELMKLDILRNHGLVLAPGVRFHLIEKRPSSLLFLYAASPQETPVEFEVPLGDYARMISSFDRYQPAMDAFFDGTFVDFRVTLH